MVVVVGLMDENEKKKLILKLIQNNVKQRENESEEQFNNRITSLNQICFKTLNSFSNSNFHKQQELTISETIKKNCKKKQRKN